MDKSRRQAMVGAAALMLPGWAALAQAQTGAANYPSAPVKIVVGFSAGGPTDLAARLIAAKLQVAFGQTFIVDNKPGASDPCTDGC
jgi:tripartite-type tricarboxylate transporter receptor subunit TctC